MTRSEKINQIIQKRQPLAKKVKDVEERLEIESKNLADLEKFRNFIIPKIDNQEVVEKLKELDIRNLRIIVSKNLQLVKKLRLRLDRGTLNIGVVGRARQGKSRLLQSVTGLGTDEIPDGDREHCTGVRSTIYHRPDDSTNNYDFDALVWFHSPQSFMEEVIKPYYEDLQLGHLPEIASFGQNEIPELPQSLASFSEYQTKYEHLKKYRKHFQQYYRLLGTTNDKPLKIRKDKIREYVAQDDKDGNRNYVNYLAVKEVKIFSSFPQEDIGKIAVIDLPGLGDTGIGDENRLIKTVGEDVDLIIFVKRPQKGDYWAEVDVKLYDITKTALIELPIKEWSYMILNHTPQIVDNYVNCQDLQRSIAEKHIDVIQSSIVDCADTGNVNGFLDNVLNYLVHSIEELDKKYARNLQISLQEVEKTVNERLEEGSKLLSGYANMSRHFKSLFNDFIKQLSKVMTTIHYELKGNLGHNDPHFEKQVKQALDNCKNYSDIPSEDQIFEMAILPDGKASVEIAYRRCIVELRASISHNFHSLNYGLKNSIDSLKQNIANKLINDVGLGNLTTHTGVDFLQFMADKLAEKNNKLTFGFQVFYEYEMSYGSLLLSSIRKHLNESLSPDSNNIENNDLNLANVKNNLLSLYDQTITNCEQTLNQWLSKPSEVQYYMFDEFIDRILYAEGMEDEWFAFLDDTEIRVQVWTEFRQAEDRKQLQMKWKHYLNSAMIETNSLRFL
ncbi:MAG: hypothetical protein F6K61_10665 [Sphaerospermopsis sp. SIO1G1]|nr:hypothetical protein [Sphaerospermopsis sp. SIO1G1]